MKNFKNTQTKIALFVFLLTISSTVIAITADDVNFCKQQARQELDDNTQMEQIKGNYNGPGNNALQIMQNAYNACIQDLANRQQRQRTIDEWQPQRQQ